LIFRSFQEDVAQYKLTGKNYTAFTKPRAFSGKKFDSPKFLLKKVLKRKRKTGHATFLIIKAFFKISRISKTIKF